MTTSAINISMNKAYQIYSLILVLGLRFFLTSRCSFLIYGNFNKRMQVHPLMRCVYACMHACMHACMCACVCMHGCACMHACVRTCVPMCACVHACVYLFYVTYLFFSRVRNSKLKHCNS